MHARIGGMAALAAIAMFGCSGGSGDGTPADGNGLGDGGEIFDAPIDAPRPDGNPGDRIPPQVINTSPANNATGTPRGAFTITFSEPIEPTSLGGSALTIMQGA